MARALSCPLNGPEIRLQSTPRRRYKCLALKGGVQIRRLGGVAPGAHFGRTLRRRFCDRVADLLLRRSGGEQALYEEIDGDGRIAAAEVHGLVAGSIASIATKPGRDPRTDAFGNVLTESWLVTTDGRTRNTADIRFGPHPAEERMATRN